MTRRIIPRAEWGARHDNGAGSRALPCKEVWLHHSVTPARDDAAAIRDLEKIGESRFGRGISYTFLVTVGGNVYEGHGIDRIGAHTANHNTVGAAICLVGNFDADHPTELQLDAVAWLLAHGYLSGWFRDPKLNGGHRDLKATACPGRHAYALITEINRRAAAVLGQIPPAPTPQPTPGGDYDMDRINLSGGLPVKGRHVDNLQALLLPVVKMAKRPDLVAKLVGADGVPDGIAGPGTAEALGVGQQLLKYLGAYTGTVDRDCGPATWRALIEF